MGTSEFDIFLSHNSTDKPAVEELARRLVKENIKPWLDIWNLIPGEPWQEAIEEALDRCATCAIFIGPSGTGPWQNEEMRAAIDRRVREGRFRVIPVVLPGGRRDQRSRLPTFLVATTWVEFRKSLDDEDAFHRLVCGIRGIEPGRGPGQAIYEGTCPYRGLQMFQAEHAPFFFGREALTEWLLDELRSAPTSGGENRFLAIIGASGSGKSSLARAGLIPALKRGELEGSGDWPIVICRPGKEPLESLAVALAADPDIGKRVAPVRGLMSDLRDDERALHLTTRTALHSAPETHRAVVLVDQFEEMFTLCQDDSLRRTLIDNLLYAAGVARGKTVVVLTMRADFYAQCAAYDTLAAALADHQVLVGPLTEEELRRAIERPAQLVGCELEAGLTELLIHDVKNQAGALPLLQHALSELWERREGRRLTRAAYDEIGRLDGALEQRANEIFDRFDKTEREMCRRIFLRLTQPGEGTEDTKRRATFQELLPTEGESESIHQVIQALADARLITTEGEKDEPEGRFIEVAHEALIRGWSKLRTWIDSDREALRVHRRLSDAAGEWDKTGRDDSYLYRGVRLAEAEEWSHTHAEILNPVERAYLQASIELRNKEHAAEELRQKQLRRRALQASIAGTIAILLAAVAFLLFLNAQSERDTASREARLATARKLAAEATAIAEEHPQRAILLSVEAINLVSNDRLRVTSAEQVLRETLAATSGRGLGSHSDAITSVAISQDGLWLASGSEDGTARLWDFEAKDPTKRPIILDGHRDVINTVAISYDSRWLVTAGGSFLTAVDTRALLWDLTTEDPSQNPYILEGHEQPIYSVAFSQNNHWLVTAGYDKTARLWDLTAKDPSEACVVLRGHTDAVTTVTISPDNHWAVTGGWQTDRTARLWDLTAQDPSKTHKVLTGHEARVWSLAISSDSRWLATGSYDSTARVWDLMADDPSRTVLVLRGHTDIVTHVAFSSNNRWLATASGDNTVRLWRPYEEAPNGSIVLDGHNRITDMAISSDDRWLITADGDGVVRLWDLTLEDPSMAPVALYGHDGSINSIAISSDNNWVVTGSSDKTMRLWDLRNPIASNTMLIFRGHTGRISDVAISSDDRWLATGSLDKTVRLWDLTANDPTKSSIILKGHLDDVSEVAFSPNNRWLATASLREDSIRLWDLSIMDFSEASLVLSGHEDGIIAAAFSPDSRWLTTASRDMTARLWDLTSKEPSQATEILRGHEAPINKVVFSPDNRWLATGGFDATARLWDLASKDRTASQIVLRQHSAWINAIAFTPDSRWLVTGSRDRTAALWDLTDLSRSPTFLFKHEGPVSAVAISPDGHWLATGSEDRTVRVWNLRATDPSRTSIVLQHDAWVDGLAISPDGRWLVAKQMSNAARLWEFTGTGVSASSIVLRTGEPTITAVAFSHDSRWVVTADGVHRTEERHPTARMWTLRIDELINDAQNRVGRNLTVSEWQRHFSGVAYRKTFAALPGGQ